MQHLITCDYSASFTARDEWKKKYFEEKKKTPPLEEQVSKLKSHVDQQYRKMLSHIEGRGKKAGQSGPPSKKVG